ncbi:MAG: hypothetical protein VW872_04865 [Candidatus Poseidoniales archaeon]
MRKDYSTLPRPPGVDELPEAWYETEGAHQFTVTLLAFSWALLPVGFMVLMAIFDRYEQHRLTLAAVALSMLVLAFISGVGQRRSALLDPRVQLATATLGSTAALLVLLFMLDLSSYWWVVYGLVFGSVAMMYVSLSHLASCNTPAVRLPWDVSVPIPNNALEGWRVMNGRWVNGVIATSVRLPGYLQVHDGLVDGEATLLCLEILAPVDEAPLPHAIGLDFSTFAALSVARSAEE